MQAECIEVDNNMKLEHQAVMLQEAITALNIQPTGIYVDCTYGRGGHAREILKSLNSLGKLLVIDKDPQAIADAKQLAAIDSRVTVCQGSFNELQNFAKEHGIVGKVNGVLFDLGVSSPQLDQSDRGFSFMRAGVLDMRMDPTTGISAAQWIASADAEQIAWVLKHLGEERFSKRIASAIVNARSKEAITTTNQLATIITNAIPVKEKHKHPATRSFQAIRIYINNELDDLTATLNQVIELLTVGGRLVAISFHSLEDRIVKQFIAEHVKGDDYPHLLPIKQAAIQPKLRKIGKALKPTEAEIKHNVRARSAIMRVAEKLARVGDVC